MGPAFILDKSAFHGLGRLAHYELRRHFYLTIPPVLVCEIAADLLKFKDDKDRSERLVQQLADNVIWLNTKLNVHYYSASCVELMDGELVGMERKPLVGPCRTVATPSGKRVTTIDPSPESFRIAAWEAGEFSDEDFKFAETWRRGIRDIDLEGFRRQFPVGRFKAKTLVDLLRAVDDVIADPEMGYVCLSYWIRTARFSKSYQFVVINRWKMYRKPLAVYAPYTAYCLRVNLFCIFGILQGFLGTRNSNVIDMEYLYYLPFAYFFTSGDEFLVKTAPLLLQPDQEFIHADDLRDALNALAAPRKSAQMSGDPDWHKIQPLDPPNGTLVPRLWHKAWGKWVSLAEREEKSRLARQTVLTPERRAELEEVLHAIRASR